MLGMLNLYCTVVSVRFQLLALWLQAQPILTVYTRLLYTVFLSLRI